MSSNRFFLDDLLNNPNAKVKISGLQKNPIIGFIDSDFSVDGSADFSSPFESSAAESLTQTVNMATSVANNIIGTNIPNLAIKNLKMTELQWTGSAKPSFNISLKFVAIRPDQDVRLPVAQLMKGVLPTVGSKFTLIAPNNYNPSNGGGLLMLELGTWFIAPNLVMKSCNFTFSKEVISSGAPLYASGTVVLEPYRAITYDDFLKFLKMSRDKVNSSSFYSRGVK